MTHQKHIEEKLIERFIKDPKSFNKKEIEFVKDRLWLCNECAEEYHQQHEIDEDFFSYIINPSSCSKSLQEKLSFQIETCPTCAQIAEEEMEFEATLVNMQEVPLPEKYKKQAAELWEKLQQEKKETVPSWITELIEQLSKVKIVIPRIEVNFGLAGTEPKLEELVDDYNENTEKYKLAGQTEDGKVEFLIHKNTKKNAVILHINSIYDLEGLKIEIEGLNPLPIPVEQKVLDRYKKNKFWKYDFLLGGISDIENRVAMGIRINLFGRSINMNL